MLPQLHTVAELGAELWPHWPSERRAKWIYRQTEEHGLPAIRLGRQLVFDPAAVQAWLQTNNGGTSEPQTQDGLPAPDSPPRR
jgi:hypothetical protein